MIYNYFVEIEFFKLNKNNPVVEFLDSLNPKERAKVVRNIELLKEFGLKIGKPYVESIGNGLFSLRTVCFGVQIRLLFCTDVGNKIIFLASFKKKTKKIPEGEIEVAKKRREEYLKGRN